MWLGIAALVAVAGCKKETPAAPAAAPAAPAAPAAAAPGGSVANITITNQGVLTLNDKSATLEDLTKLLTGAGPRPSSIVYTRPDRGQQPSPEAAPLIHGVLQLIVDSKIPARIATAQ